MEVKVRPGFGAEAKSEVAQLVPVCGVVVWQLAGRGVVDTAPGVDANAGAVVDDAALAGTEQVHAAGGDLAGGEDFGIETGLPDQAAGVHIDSIVEGAVDLSEDDGIDFRMFGDERFQLVIGCGAQVAVQIGFVALDGDCAGAGTEDGLIDAEGDGQGAAVGFGEDAGGFDVRFVQVMDKDADIAGGQDIFSDGHIVGVLFLKLQEVGFEQDGALVEALFGQLILWNLHQQGCLPGAHLEDEEQGELFCFHFGEEESDGTGLIAHIDFGLADDGHLCFHDAVNVMRFDVVVLEASPTVVLVPDATALCTGAGRMHCGKKPFAAPAART